MHYINYIPVLIYLAIFLLILMVSEISYKWVFKDSELTRKISHTMTGVVALGIPKYFDGFIEVIILAVFSFLLLFVSKKIGVFPSIHKLSRKSFGASLLPVSIFFCYALSEVLGHEEYYYIPVLILAISDSAAGIIGGRVRSFHWKRLGAIAATKTFLGSLIFFISSFFILFFAIPAFYSFSTLVLLFISLSIAAISTTVELFSGNGIDNLTVPLSTIAVLFVMNSCMV